MTQAKVVCKSKYAVTVYWSHYCIHVMLHSELYKLSEETAVECLLQPCGNISAHVNKCVYVHFYEI